jgi:imidazoleglycerol-phosphate dehydratase
VTEGAAAQIAFDRAGESSIATGVAVLDHLLLELAEAGRFGLRLEIAPAEPEAEVDSAGASLGTALRPLLGQRGVGIVAADEALAMVVVEASGEALVASNADLTSTKAGGLRTDLAASFLRGLAEEAGLTIHVRLFEGEDSQHVLEAIFKALGVALADARREE